MILKSLILFFFFPIFLLAQYDRPGSADAQFLKISISPRGSALGDALISTVQGAEATYYNSAALPLQKRTDIVFNHTQWFAGIKHDFAAVAMNFDDYGSLGLSFTGLYTDEMKVTTPLQPEGTGETFYATNYRIGLSYARNLTDRVTLGTTVSYITMSLYKGFTANAVSVDIATLYVSDFHGFRFGMQIANFGSSIKYVNESFPLPTNFTFGMGINALEFKNQTVLFSFSLTKPNEGAPQGGVGAEWNFQDMLFLRGGYRVNNSVANYSFGAGVKVDVFGYLLRFDYSLSNFILLNAVHRFGLGITL